MLAALATVLVMYVVQQERKSGGFMLLGAKKPRATLGSNNVNCNSVSIDSPDFARCSTTLGTGRTVLPGNPTKTAHNISTDFVKQDYADLGNPFGMKISDGYEKEEFKRHTVGASSISDSRKPISQAGAQAFPFSQNGSVGAASLTPTSVGPFAPSASSSSSGGVAFKPSGNTTSRFSSTVEAPPRGSARSSSSVGVSHESGMSIKTAYLGAAVSPSSKDSLGASPQEIAQSAAKLEGVDTVTRSRGGQLNLLIHPNVPIS